MTVREFIRVLMARKALIGAAIIVSALAGIFVVLAEGVAYRGDTEVVISQQAVGTAGTAGLTTQQKLNLIAVTYAEMVRTRRFVDRAASNAGISRNGASVSAQSVASASVVRISVRSDKRRQASEVASAVSAELVKTAQRDTFRAALVESPKTRRDTRSPALTLAAALAVGLGVAVAVALVLDTSV